MKVLTSGKSLVFTEMLEAYFKEGCRQVDVGKVSFCHTLISHSLNPSRDCPNCWLPLVLPDELEDFCGRCKVR